MEERKLRNLKFIVDVINDAISKEAYKSAFINAFIIPDLCGQIEHDCSKGNKTAYVSWYNEYIFKYENTADKNVIDGDIIYLIRCKLFHEGNMYHKEIINNLKNKYKVIDKVDDYNLRIDMNEICEVDQFSVLTSDRKMINIDISINIINFTKKIVSVAEGYIELKSNNC
ncbi:hypothetical protein Q3C87_08150 [Enterococcus faecium]|uniref:hypothetical protein n=1 Tax=Enterococcus hirae TaxID=1354 RepID=UPI00280D26CF|nr:hypothetical protein [Enterococcus faecium]MDQ8252487.1 hypothetical protein [Enterococcus faecium]NTK36283.1 hypothetical protein [Enterococcus faecium]